MRGALKRSEAAASDDAADDEATDDATDGATDEESTEPAEDESIAWFQVGETAHVLIAGAGRTEALIAAARGQIETLQ